MTALEIVGPSGEKIPRGDTHEILALDLVQSQQLHIAKLQNKLSARQIRLVRVALEEMAARVTNLEITGTWTHARMLHTMMMLSRGIVQLVGEQKSTFTEDLKLISLQSQKDAAKYLATLDRHFFGVATPLHFDSLAWWEETHKNIGRVRLRQYDKSWLRYGSTVTRKIEDILAKTTLIGEPWHEARDKVLEATKDVVHGNQYWVDRILKTESSAVWNGVQLAALQDEDTDEEPMLKKLVTHFDIDTGADSVALHGQTRPVDKPFYDAVNRITYMAPPNRPHDREIIVGWRKSYGDDFDDYDKETATDYDPEIHGDTKKDLDQTGQAEDPTGLMTAARPKKSPKVVETEPTPQERSEQLDVLRLKRQSIRARFDRAREMSAHLRRQIRLQGDNVSPSLKENYQTQAGLAVALSSQLEEHRRWIDMLTMGAMV